MKMIKNYDASPPGTKLKGTAVCSPHRRRVLGYFRPWICFLSIMAVASKSRTLSSSVHVIKFQPFSSKI